MHITILADAIDNQTAGIHKYTKCLIKELLKTDSSNKYSFIHCQNNSFFNELDHYVIPQKKGPGTESFRRFIQIPNLIKKINPDIVLQPCHIGPFRIPKHIKRAVTIHDLTPIIYPQFHTLRGVTVHKLLLKKTLKNADLILTPSHTTKNDIIRLYNPTAKITVTPLGITPHTQSQPTTRPITTPYILYLGTIEPRKNLETLIEAFLELKEKQLIPHQLVLAGGMGWKNNKILKKTNHPSITLTGYISDKERNAYYQHSDMFIYPSIYEGFGLPPLEAMSYKIPVICSTGGSLKEIFKNTALTFDPMNKEHLKNLIIKLHNSPFLKKELAQKGYEYSKQFTWAKTAQKTSEAFEQICSITS